MTYTVKQIQERYGVSQATVLHWCATGQLKALNVGRDPGKKRSRLRISQAAVDAFEIGRAVTPPPQPIRRRRKQASDVIEFIK